MHAKSAIYYDAIYAAVGKDYAREAAYVDAVIQENSESIGRDLLDVACGTGGHVLHLKALYNVEGLDLDDAMLAVARRKSQATRFHHGDMRTFDIGRTFDAVICLFSAIGYVGTVTGLRQAVGNLTRHVSPGGVLVVEPWFTPELYNPGHVHGVFVDEPQLKIARMSVARLNGNLSVFDFHYLIATPDGVEHFTERHELGLFFHSDYMAAFRLAGLRTIYDPEGPTGRGLYLGVKRSS